MIPFIKMHGIGNDYLYVDGRKLLPRNLSELAVKMSAAHFGCSADGLIVILASNKADFRFRIFNNDGSEAGMCGNGLRCVARYCHDLGLTDKREFTIETESGIKKVQLTLDDQGNTLLVRGDMGRPELDGHKIPSRLAGCPVVDAPIEAGGETFLFTLVNMGNPHAVCFVEDPCHFPVEKIGPVVEHSPFFPERTNVEFVQVLEKDHIRMRVWERGTGETLACGTGACAAAVASILKGLCTRSILADLPGGSLRIEWDKQSGIVYQQGSASFVYQGWYLEDGEIPSRL